MRPGQAVTHHSHRALVLKGAREVAGIKVVEIVYASGPHRGCKTLAKVADVQPVAKKVAA